MKILSVAINKFVNLLHKFYHPITIGARAVILNDEKDSVLLVKLSYAEGWYLPGGKLKKNEMIIDGLKRELREEIDFTVDENSLELLGIYNNFYEGKSDTIIVLICSGHMNKNVKNLEIEEHQYFRFDDLPEDLSPGTKRRLDEYMKKSTNNIGSW